MKNIIFAAVCALYVPWVYAMQENNNNKSEQPKRDPYSIFEQFEGGWFGMNSQVNQLLQNENGRHALLYQRASAVNLGLVFGYVSNDPLCNAQAVNIPWHKVSDRTTLEFLGDILLYMVTKGIARQEEVLNSPDCVNDSVLKDQLQNTIGYSRDHELFLLKEILENDNNELTQGFDSGILLTILQSTHVQWLENHVNATSRPPSAYEVMVKILEQRAIKGTDKKDPSALTIRLRIPTQKKDN
jgi:hypothetical protein